MNAQTGLSPAPTSCVHKQNTLVKHGAICINEAPGQATRIVHHRQMQRDAVFVRREREREGEREAEREGEREAEREREREGERERERGTLMPPR